MRIGVDAHEEADAHHEQRVLAHAAVPEQLPWSPVICEEVRSLPVCPGVSSCRRQMCHEPEYEPLEDAAVAAKRTMESQLQLLQGLHRLGAADLGWPAYAELTECCIPPHGSAFCHPTHNEQHLSENACFCCEVCHGHGAENDEEACP